MKKQHFQKILNQNSEHNLRMAASAFILSGFESKD